MPLSEPELLEVLAALCRARSLEWPRLAKIRSYMLNQADDIYVPEEANQEFRMLVDQARFNVMPLVVSAVAQNLFVDGYRPTGPNGRAPSSENAEIWSKAWQANRMDARQAGLYRGAIKYGASYATVVPGKPGPKITPWSPFRLTALYEDHVNDAWPRYAMTVDQPDVLNGQRPAVDPALSSSSITGSLRVRVWDEDHIYTMEVENNGANGKLAKVEAHGLGVTPVVRFLDEYELDGESLGKIEPLLPLQRQLNQTTFSLLMTQQYAAFRQRWATGMAIEIDQTTGQPKEPFNSAVNAVWQNESPDGKFGDFSESNLSGYLESRDKTLLLIANTAPIPPHNLLVGNGISNISADALAAIEKGHRDDVDEHQTSFGESIEQLMRLSGLADGDEETWEDTSAQTVWRDTTTRSLGQVIDALVKIASGLGVPVQALWERIPGVTDQDIARWMEIKDEEDLMGEIRALISGTTEDGEEDDPDADGSGDEVDPEPPE